MVFIVVIVLSAITFGDAPSIEDDVASIRDYLASDAASFITGQTIMIDGGWAMH